MAGRLQVERTDDFTGGLNLRADAFQLGGNESPDLLNVDIDPRGGFSMRRGIQRWNTAAVGAIGAGLFTPKRLWVWENPTPQVLVAANSKIFYATAGTFTDTTITTTAAHGASFAAWSGATSAVYIASGTGSVGNKWSGSAKTALTASGAAQWQTSFASPTGVHMPKADHCATHQSRMWVASTSEDGTAFPDRIRWSHPLFPESWRQEDYIDIPEGGSGITALVSFGETLLVFKKRSVHAIYGFDNDTWSKVQLTGKLGTVSPQTVAVTEGMVYFFCWPDGLFGFDGQGFHDLFMSMRPMIQSGQITDASIGNAHVSVLNRRVWVSLPAVSTTTANFSLVLDPSLGNGGSWVKFQLAGGVAGVAAGADFTLASGQRLSLACHPTEPYVLQVDVDGSVQDNQTGTLANFTSYYVTRWQDAGGISNLKMWRRPDLIVKQVATATSLTVQGFQDWDSGSVKRLATVVVPSVGAAGFWRLTGVEVDAYPGWGQMTWGAAESGSGYAHSGNLGLARSVQLKISGAGGAAWGVDSISYKFIPRKLRS